MGNYENLKQSITEVIRTNGNQEITGAVLQSTLLTIISTVGANATFAGVATPTTNPGTPDGSVFYLASESGTYPNFGSIELQDELSVLMWNGSWSKQQIFSIDDVPTAGSDNLVKSGGVFNNIGALDISELNATETPHTLATYEDLASALNALPISYRKGGMSVKFVQSSDNKYVQFRFLLSGSFTAAQFADVANWQKSGAEVIVLQNTQTGHTEIHIGSDSYPVPSTAEANGLEAIVLGKSEFSIKGKVYKNGVLTTENNVNSTELIALDGLSILSFSLNLNEVGQVVSFFDEDRVFIPSISIDGISGGATFAETLYLKNSIYVDAKYVAFSNYAPATSSFYKFGNIVTELSFLNNLIGIKATDFNINDKIYNNGVLIISPGSKSTHLIDVDGITSIDYCLRLNESGHIISFFDDGGNFISGIKASNSGLATKTGSITFESTNIKYVAFSCWNPINEHYIKINGTIDERIKDLEAVKYLLGIPIDMYANAGYYCVNGVLTTADANAYSSRIIDISFAKFIRYRLRLNNTAQIISFFDSNLDYLSSISITASTTPELQTIEGVIDLSDANYADARFVAFSCFGYNDTFYVELGSSNDYYSQIKQLQNERPFLVGRKFCALGDSITDGDGNNSYSWYDMLLKRYNSVLNSLNFAETGQCLRTMSDLCTAQNMAGVDICFVMGGTNQLSNYRLGTINDDATPDRWQPNKAYSVGDKVLGGTMEEHGWTTHIKAYLYWYECVVAGTSGNAEDASGFNHTVDSITNDGTVQWKCLGNPSWYSDMKGICRRVWGFNPKIQIIWIVPIKTKNDADVLNPELWERAEKFQAIRNFCNANSIRFIDLQKEFPLNAYTKNAIMADNLHPNDSGYQIIQDIVCSHIE